MPYAVGFIVVVLGLAAFVYIGLNWATGPGRVAALATQPTPTPAVAVAVAPPEPTTEPTPPPADLLYIVKSGDNPAAIARQFGVKTDDLMSYNNIDNPQKLQIGQTLKIPPPPAH